MREAITWPPSSKSSTLASSAYRISFKVLIDPVLVQVGQYHIIPAVTVNSKAVQQEEPPPYGR